jgi:hypothetical protein
MPHHSLLKAIRPIAYRRTAISSSLRAVLVMSVISLTLLPVAWFSTVFILWLLLLLPYERLPDKVSSQSRCITIILFCLLFL